MKKCKYNIKCYFDDKKLAGGTTLYFLYLLYRLWVLTFKYGEYQLALDYLKEIERLGMYGSIILLVLSYYYINKMNEQEYTELLRADKNAYRSFVYGRLGVLFQIEAAIVGLMCLGSVIHLADMGRQDPLVITHIVMNILLYVCVPMAICILLGCVLALYLRYQWAYTIIFIMWFAVTSLSEVIAVQLREGIDLNLYTVLNLLKIGAPDLNYTTNSMYGIPIEIFQWALRSIWIFALFLLLLRRVNKTAVRRQVLLSGAVFLCIPFLVCQGSRMQQENMEKSGMGEWEKYYAEEWNNYNQNGQRAYLDTRDSAVDVERYGLNIDLGRELKAEANIIVKNPQEKMWFTLFEGYTVTKVEDAKGKKLPFEQKGHYIVISGENRESMRNITIAYKGSSQKFYSNNQGAYLPGYFPYYPMPGKRTVIEYLRAELADGYTDFAGFNTHIDDLDKKEFELHITGTDKPVFTNLTKTGNNTWEGNSQTVTILSGLVQETKTEDASIYSAIGQSGIEGMLEQAKQVQKSLNANWGIDTSMDVKKMFCIDPMVNYMACEKEDTVDLGDHIIVNAGAADTWAIDLALNPMSNTGEKELLKEILKNRMVFGFEPKEENVAFEVMPAEVMNSELLDYLLNRKVTELGEEKVVQEVYRYLKDDNITEDPQVFLKRL